VIRYCQPVTLITTSSLFLLAIQLVATIGVWEVKPQEDCGLKTHPGTGYGVVCPELPQSPWGLCQHMRERVFVGLGVQIVKSV